MYVSTVSIWIILHSKLQVSLLRDFFPQNFTIKVCVLTLISLFVLIFPLSPSSSKACKILSHRYVIFSHYLATVSLRNTITFLTTFLPNINYFFFLLRRFLYRLWYISHSVSNHGLSVHDPIAKRTIPDLNAMMLRGVYISASLHRTGTGINSLLAPQEPHEIT
jgi:hypothetical protein